MTYGSLNLQNLRIRKYVSHNLQNFILTQFSCQDCAYKFDFLLFLKPLKFQPSFARLSRVRPACSMHTDVVGSLCLISCRTFLQSVFSNVSYVADKITIQHIYWFSHVADKIPIQHIYWFSPDSAPKWRWISFPWFTGWGQPL